MSDTKTTLVELKSLMTEAGDKPELKEAMKELVKQVQNFHQTCMDEINQL